ncbi:MAG: hypothetical protein XD98_0158 [Microgenomates bacterium 39_6]|nr:MAG: hypothetical protein XD98_0158 [Microgenomates bacterium 39_6]
MAQQDDKDQVSFLALERKIRRTHNLIKDAKDKLKEQRDIFKDAFENDSVYQDHQAKYDEARSTLSATKKQILKDPAVAAMEEKVKEMRLAIRQLQDSLSSDLQQYQSLTGEKVIETDEGRLMEIVSKAKLVRRS